MARLLFLLAALFLVGLATLRFGGILVVRGIDVIFVNGHGPSQPGHLSRQAVKNLTRIGYKDNIFKLDLKQARERLMAHPWVKWVHIERSWFRGIVRVYVREREPVGRVEGTGGKGFVVDAEGVVLGADLRLKPVVRCGFPLPEGIKELPWAGKLLAAYHGFHLCSSLYPIVDLTGLPTVTLRSDTGDLPPVVFDLVPGDGFLGGLRRAALRLEALISEVGAEALGPFGVVDCCLPDGCVLIPGERPSAKGG